MPRPPAPQVKKVSSSGPSGMLIGIVAVLVIALIAGLIYVAVRGESALEASGSTGAQPEGAGVVVGAGSDVPEVHVYEDPQCPWCGVLERSIGPTVDELVDAGDVTMRYTIMSFLDSNLGNDSSKRATNAALCADDAGAFAAYHEQLYADQPQEGAGWTDEQLLALGEQAGLSGADRETFATCVSDLTHEDYVADMQERANRDGISGTPRLFIDGEQISDDDMRRLMDDGSQLSAIIESYTD